MLSTNAINSPEAAIARSMWRLATASSTHLIALPGAAEALGFVHKGGAGSHRAFARAGEPMLFNFQNRDGRIPPYQARQLIAMIEKYGENQ